MKVAKPSVSFLLYHFLSVESSKTSNTHQQKETPNLKMASATAHAKREMLDQLQQAMSWPVSSSTTGKITTPNRSIAGGSSASSSSYSTSFLSSQGDPTSDKLTSARNSRDFAFSPASPFSPTSDRSRTTRTNTVVHMKTKAGHLPSKSGTTSFYAQIPKVPLCEDLDDQVLRKGEACFSDCGKSICFFVMQFLFSLSRFLVLRMKLVLHDLHDR